MHALAGTTDLSPRIAGLMRPAECGFSDNLTGCCIYHLVLCKSAAAHIRVLSAPKLLELVQAEDWCHTEAHDNQDTMPGVG